MTKIFSRNQVLLFYLFAFKLVQKIKLSIFRVKKWVIKINQYNPLKKIFHIFYIFLLHVEIFILSLKLNKNFQLILFFLNQAFGLI